MTDTTQACLASLPPAPAERGSARRYMMGLATVAGALLLVGLIVHAGPARLAGQLRALGPLLPVLLVLTGVRYLLQAAGWRLAITSADRPGWTACINAVVAGEALGYVAWGPIAREPAKAFFLRPRVPVAVALSAALAERAVFVVTAAALAVVAAGLVAPRRWLVMGLAAAAVTAIGLAAVRRRRRVPPGDDRVTPQAALDVPRDLWYRRPRALLGIAGLAIGQEAINVLEAYLVFTWLGAAPTVVVAIAFEGISRFVNAAGQFVPGRVGVYEAASALLADALALGASHGVSLALARRTRSLMWAVPGALLLVHRGYSSAPAVPRGAAGNPPGAERIATVGF